MSLYAKRNSPEARAASDFNPEPIYRSDGFLEFFVILNRFIDINAGTAILTTIGTARIKCYKLNTYEIYMTLCNLSS